MPTGNLSDPTFEPSDAQLSELTQRAFAEVPRRNQQANAKLRSEIETMRTAIRLRLAGKLR